MLPPSPSPSAPAPSSALAPIDTADWTTYESDLYGFIIGHPPGWTERPADHAWSLAADADFLNSATEGFRAPGSTILVTAWSVRVDPAAAQDWIASTYCPATTSPCDRLGVLSVPVALDGHPGTLVHFLEDTQAFVPVGDRMYIVAVWEPETDIRTAPYGGATRLLEGFLSTMHLLPGGPTITPTPPSTSTGPTMSASPLARAVSRQVV